MGYLSDEVKLTLVQAALADGQTDPNSSSVDMSGYDGCMFVAIVGTITTTGTVAIAVEQSSDDGSSDAFAAVTGASAQADLAADSDKLLVVDVQTPRERYLRVAMTRATANSIVGGVIAIQYKASSLAAATATAQLAASIAQVYHPAES